MGVLGILVLLVLPIRLFGGHPVGAAAATLHGSTAGHPVVYVVQPGDTLWSIATRIDPTGDPRPLVDRLAAQIGSDTVVPGEHLTLP